MIEKKVKGQEIKAVPATPRRTGQVVDIFATLKKSLETAERPQRKATADQTQAQKEGVGPDGIQCN
jgi:non-homologous end joining protein Ku